jgi:hypothetical protein
LGPGFSGILCRSLRSSLETGVEESEEEKRLQQSLWLCPLLDVVSSLASYQPIPLAKC